MREVPFDKTTPWSNPQKWEQDHLNSYKSSPPQKPKKLTLEDVFPYLDRYAIGFGQILDGLVSSKPMTYPPYNINKYGEGNFEIELALAGFKKSDLKIALDDRTLSITSVIDTEEEVESVVALHHGIAKRNFTTSFTLAPYVEVDSAIMEDGILTIKLVTNIPDEKKPKVIDIQ